MYEVTIYYRDGAKVYTGTHEQVVEIRAAAIERYIACSGVHQVAK